LNEKRVFAQGGGTVAFSLDESREKEAETMSQSIASVGRVRSKRAWLPRASRVFLCCSLITFLFAESAATQSSREFSQALDDLKDERLTLVERVAAADLYKQKPGSRTALDIFNVGEGECPAYLAEHLGGILYELDEPKTQTKLRKLAEKKNARRHVRFGLLGAHPPFSSKFFKNLLGRVGREKDPLIREDLVSFLLRYEVPEALPVILKTLNKKNTQDTEQEAYSCYVIDALTVDLPGTLDEDALVDLLDQRKTTAAVKGQVILGLGRMIAQSGSPELLELISGELVDDNPFYTQVAALEALTMWRDRSVVDVLERKLDLENPDIHRRIFDCLTRLTGQTRASVRGWKSLLSRDADLVQVLTEEEAHERQVRIAEAEDDLSLSRYANHDFAGLGYEPERVIFLVDVSGSMDECISGAKTEESVTRLDFAKQELIRNLEVLSGGGVLFDIVPFEGSARRWNKGGVTTSTQGKLADSTVRIRKATAFVEELSAGGGTNLSAALELALGDSGAENIVLLSDGAPSEGIIDPEALTRRVKCVWNAGRRVKIHTIAFGGGFQVLKKLSEDSGGSFSTIDDAGAIKLALSRPRRR
jgi:hypothetical protein